MDDDIGNVYDLMLVVGGAGDVGELEELFNDGKYGHDGFAKMKFFILYHVLALEDFMCH